MFGGFLLPSLSLMHWLIMAFHCCRCWHLGCSCHGTVVGVGTCRHWLIMASTRHAAGPWLGVQLSWHCRTGMGGLPYPTLAAPAISRWDDCSLSTECRHLECPATPAPLRRPATLFPGDGAAALHGGHNSNHNTSSENAKA